MVVTPVTSIDTVETEVPEKLQFLLIVLVTGDMIVCVQLPESGETALPQPFVETVLYDVQVATARHEQIPMAVVKVPQGLAERPLSELRMVKSVLTE
ncbi:hypothetical protein Pcinc_005616 [Petrolisthes cinctipes]|uniref:Uncharacterized protein n=1 Tax=Petrolisthes cinctipes TaxID=88211 RepID=A0AAE1FN21_PETCI|nr:hypothetical protein Pcinc_018393 [Petrolisthes cinctipes]KAK3890431.1 hypothetical protein Pcinc_005616 [Petrolisthes cinctipes]